MSNLIQFARGAALLCSIALVACYIDVYTTGKFPWQHAAAEETPVTIPLPEFVSDPAVQQTQYVQAPAAQEQRIFMAGSKSDVAASAIVVQSTAANGPNNPTPAAAPVFMSGSKSYGGATGLIPGALNPAPTATTQTEQKAPAFMGGSKTIMLPPRLPESAQPRTVTPTQSPQFMGGAKSPGPLVMPNSPSPPSTYPPPPTTVPSGVKVQGYPTTNPVQGVAPQTSSPASTTNPLFMSGSKSPIREAPKNLFSDPPTTQKPTTPNAMQKAPTPAPLQITPKVAPNSPPVQQVTPRYYGDQPVSPAKSY